LELKKKPLFKNMKKIPYVLIKSTMALSFFFSLANVTYALSDYTPLAPLPNLQANDGTTNFQTYIPGVFTLSIGIAAVLAFVMITIGGITYATSDALTGKQNGRKYIEDALWGLLLVIGAYVILNTINPKILVFDLDIPSASDTASSTPPVSSQRPMTQEEIAADAAVRSRLNSSGVGINAGPCTQGQISGCTNLNGLPESAVRGLIALKQACSCTITVTGGTEPGAHATHGVGQPIVDIRDDGAFRSWLTSKKYLTSGQTFARVPLVIPPFSNSSVGMTYEALGGNPNGTSTGAHWHAVF
jgi:hypothetical protein